MTLMPERTEPQPVNEVRGVLFALAIIPVGIILWGIVWSFGFISAIVGFAVAIGAMFLYKLGTGGRITRKGAMFVSIITLVTLALAFFGGIVLDALKAFSELTGRSQLDLFGDPLFWDRFFALINEPGVLADYTGNILLALLFGVLGCFVVIRNAFREASAPAVAPGAPVAPSTVTDAGSSSAPPIAQTPAEEFGSQLDPEAPRS